jgi:hypothetical protein
MDCLINIIRKPHGLVVLVSRVLAHIDRENDIFSMLSVNSTLGLYELVEYPLELLMPSLFTKKDELIASWNYLSCIEELNAETLFHILVVVINTVGEPLESELAVPALPSDISRQVLKVTAANPRAYKGTKYKPPKLRVISSVDLRLYLCDRKHQNQLLLRLSKYWGEALIRFDQAGYEINFLSLFLNRKN